MDIMSACCAVFLQCINCSALLVPGRGWGTALHALLSLHDESSLAHGLLQPVLGSCLLATCSIFDLTMQAY